VDHAAQGHGRDHPDRRPDDAGAAAQRVRAVIQRRARREVCGADRVAGAWKGDRRASRRQSTHEKGRGAVQDRPDAFSARRQAHQAQLLLAQTRLRQTRALAATGAGSKFDEERYESDVRQLKAQLDQARWDLSQTVTYAPADGTPINVQLRPGSYLVPAPFAPAQAMSFVEDEYQVIALYKQNELTQVEPGNEAEIALPTYPGDIIKATVDSIVWAQGQGQIAPGGPIPQTGSAPLPPGRFAVKLTIAEKDRERFLAAGAMGDAAIYTSGMAPIHIIRKVILRVGSYTNYLILKLH
jgi:multidrug resistance efflux pump